MSTFQYQVPGRWPSKRADEMAGNIGSLSGYFSVVGYEGNMLTIETDGDSDLIMSYLDRHFEMFDGVY